MEKSILYLFIPSILFTMLIAIINSDIAKHYGYTTFDIPLLLSYHHFDITSKNFFITISAFMMHHLYVAYILMNYVHDDLKGKSTIVFTRTNKKIHWFIMKVLNLFIYISIYYALQFGVTMITLLACGMESFYDGWGIVKLWVHVVLVGFCIVLCINVLSLFMNPVFAYTLVIGSCMLGLFSMTYFIEFEKESLEILSYIPTSISIYMLHRDVSYGRDIFEFFLVNYRLTYTYLKIIAFCSVCILIGAYRIKRKDLL
jgi:hypothetical protein